MQKLRFIAATVAAALCALALSVGAALAEEHNAPATKPAANGAKPAPKGVCILHDLDLVR
jgi:hypothetical protein